MAPRERKWPTLLTYTGGKTWAIPSVLPHVPLEISRFISPFLGGGAVELAVMANRKRRIGEVRLSDRSRPLVSVWHEVRTEPTWVGQRLAAYERERESREKEIAEWVGDGAPQHFFYELRDRYNWGWEPPTAFLWLAARAFSGMARFNGVGEFNAPMDTRKLRPLPSAGRLQVISLELQRRNAKVRCQDWRKAMDGAGDGDVIFLDPPYVGTYDGYGTAGWDEAEQAALLRSVASAVSAGAMVFLCETAAVLPAVKRMGLAHDVIVNRAKATTINGAVVSTMAEVVVMWGGPRAQQHDTEEAAK